MSECATDTSLSTASQEERQRLRRELVEFRGEQGEKQPTASAGGPSWQAPASSVERPDSGHRALARGFFTIVRRTYCTWVCQA
jgi:hypothetical protein